MIHRCIIKEFLLIMYKQELRCRCCGGDRLFSILNLGDQPWCNNFLTAEEVGKETKYPLHLVYCPVCELLQLNYTVPKEVMFKKHTYLSGVTQTLKRHFYDLAKENVDQFGLKEHDLIIDIGGNDGTQLAQYQRAGCKNVLNVESADNIAKISENAGIPTLNSFFNEETAKTLPPGKTKLINASGVFFHLEELHSVLRGIKYLLADNGVFVVQFMYAGTMIDKLNFDTIYHEHLCYYTLTSLAYLLDLYDLRIFDAYYSPIHSGSIIAKIRHGNDLRYNTPRYYTTLNKDKTYTLQKFQDFAKKVEDRRYKLRYELNKLIAQGKKIYTYGAPAKGNTLLNYFDIGVDLIQKAVEVNPLKIGLYLPGSHIPIVKESLDDVPDYYLLLAHNFLEEILENNKINRERGLKFIVPFPEIEII